MLLHALPEPILANVDKSPSTLYNFASAKTRHAYPAADDANPAAVGKLFSEQIWIFQSNMSTYKSPSLCALLFTKSYIWIV